MSASRTRTSPLALGVVTLASVIALMKFLSEISMTFGGVGSNEAVACAILYAGALIISVLAIALPGAMAFRERQLFFA